MREAACARVGAQEGRGTAGYGEERPRPNKETACSGDGRRISDEGAAGRGDEREAGGRESTSCGLEKRMPG